MKSLIEQLAADGLELHKQRAYEAGIEAAIKIVQKFPDRADELLRLTLRDAMSVGCAKYRTTEEGKAVVEAMWFQGRVM